MYLVVSAPRLGFVSIASIAVYVRFYTTIQTLDLLDLSLEADRTHASLLIWVFAVFTLTLSFLSVAAGSKPLQFQGSVAVPPLTTSFWFVLLLSAAVSVAYYAAVGYVPLLSSLEAALTGVDEDVAGLRLNAYAGTRYLFPGYVNQFKNALYPALVTLAIVAMYRYKFRYRAVTSSVLAASSLFFIAGTGQRGALIIVTGIIGLFMISYDRTKSPKLLVLLGALATSVLLIGTFALGRSSKAIAAAEGTLESVLVVGRELLDRVFGFSGGGAILGFRYVYYEPTQWGGDWYRSIVGMLPGRRYSGLDSLIFELLYGSRRGTTSPSVLVSSYYNWGYVGSIIFFFLYAVVVFKLSTALASSRQVTAMELMGATGTGALFALWRGGAPVFLFNFGLPAFLLLWFFGRRQHPEEAASSGENTVNVQVFNTERL